MDKPNCYKCKFRGAVPGSAHSSCNVVDNVGALLLSAVFMKHPNSLVISTTNKETGEKTEETAIEFDSYGIKSGWAMWPVNFDPVWLRKCKFYQAK